ncbi:MAG: gamma-glutamyltransferase family protein [Hyphomonadaceae bacterium]|nr:gamma-glutamyltransferase family protein [Hyphomonadaceae bacterium]
MTPTSSRLLPLATAALLALSACITAPVQQVARPVERGEAMAAAADPRAVDAALEMMRRGGSAVDAAIAAELVLGLVEPQSSGIGGGGFLLFYDAVTESITGFDGRERAPAGATPDMFLSSDGEPMDFYDAQASGRSIGTPLLVPMLKLAHEHHGRLPWTVLFEPAIRLAEDGWEISPMVAAALRSDEHEVRLRDDPAARAYFYDADGDPWPAGHVLRNPGYAATLRALAAQGPRAMSEGEIAQSIVAAAQRGPRAGTLALEDLQSARAQRFDPLCAPHRLYIVCTAAPPSSANATLAILGLYERTRPQPGGPDSVDDWAAFLWASRLAYADRDHYMADSEFVPTPTRELFAPSYLDERARQIDLRTAPDIITPGMPAGRALFERWGSAYSEDVGTTHLSIVDPFGNAVSLTATIESAFGAQRMASGFLLNNQLTDFSFRPTINGRPVANAVAPRKRPRSSMSPTIVTDRDGELVLVIGSPGGSDIIGYVARATIGILDWNLPVQDALALGNATARFSVVNAEHARWPDGVAAALEQRGWRFEPTPEGNSGLHAIRVTPQGLEGGADPRGEGAVGRLPAQ